ncbi:CD59 glycoprotein [Lamprotornis superbus]|uniref:CD59 glycoprotein n=1 Tax=Lamprotornis superbus TaxID=245042 RepID=A0A835NL24_9PASS|nr:CD59 glycoprotein [Lamprotornis superbus]
MKKRRAPAPPAARPDGAGSSATSRRPTQRSASPAYGSVSGSGRCSAPPRRRYRLDRQHRQRQYRPALPHTPGFARGRCYHCDNSPTLCRTNSTCLTTEDTCLQLKSGKLRTFSCWRTSQCRTNEIANAFMLDNFEFFCCQQDLCNESTITGVNKAAFSIASVMAMLWMLM